MRRLLSRQASLMELRAMDSWSTALSLALDERNEFIGETGKLLDTKLFRSLC